MIIILVIGFLFYRMANEAGMNKFLWPALGIIAYFVAQFVVGFIVAIINPELITSTMSQIILGLASGIIGVSVIYLVFQNAKKNQGNKPNDSNLIDTDL